MLFTTGLLIVFVALALKISPKEKQEDAHVHGAGQIGLLAAIALFGVDYFTSYFYATGEMMSALHPYGLQQYGYIAVAFIAIANVVFGALYMYSLGVFNHLCRILASANLAIPDARLSTLWFERRRLSSDQSFFAYSEHSLAVLAFRPHDQRNLAQCFCRRCIRSASSACGIGRLDF